MKADDIRDRLEQISNVASPDNRKGQMDVLAKNLLKAINREGLADPSINLNQVMKEAVDTKLGTDYEVIRNAKLQKQQSTQQRFSQPGREANDAAAATEVDSENVDSNKPPFTHS